MKVTRERISNMNVLLLIFVALQVAFATRVTLYENKWQEGSYIDFSIRHGECSNVPSDSFYARTTSINTGGACLILCSRRNCQGHCIRVSPGCGYTGGCCPEHGHLGQCQFNDLTASVRKC